MPKYTKEKIEDIQYDYGQIFKNYGEADQEELGVFNGGAKVSIGVEGHYLEFDGAAANEKEFIIDDITAVFESTIKNSSQDTLMLKLPFATKDDDGVITIGRSNLGLVSGDKYLNNITIFGKLLKGTYKKVTIYNLADFSGLDMEFKPKGEGEYAMSLAGHLDGTREEDVDLLVKIEDITSIEEAGE